MIAEALADVLRGGWARYLELEDGTQVRTAWHQEGDLRWLHVENTETGHAVNLNVTVSAEVITQWEVTPEEDGALREELAVNGPEEDGHWGMVAAGDLVQGENGAWYEVLKTAVGGGGNIGLVMVTLLIDEPPGRTYPFQPSTPVRLRRGADGAAVQMFDQAGLDPEVLKS